MEPAALHLDVSGATATVRIDHPARRNAMTTEMWQTLPDLLKRCAADPAVRVLVLTGQGGTFCAGADITTLAADDGLAPQGLSVAAEEALAAFPKPTIAAVRGHCVGGGCQLAAACDLRFAAEGAMFGVTPARLGIAYPATSTRRLAGLVGPSAAKYLLFSAELIDSERALRVGLVDEVWPEEELGPRVAEFAEVLAGRSLLSQVAAKAALTTDGDGTEWSLEARRSGETAEGVAAFLERRAPQFGWTGAP